MVHALFKLSYVHITSDSLLLPFAVRNPLSKVPFVGLSRVHDAGAETIQIPVFEETFPTVSVRIHAFTLPFHVSAYPETDKDVAILLGKLSMPVIKAILKLAYVDLPSVANQLSVPSDNAHLVVALVDISTLACASCVAMQGVEVPMTFNHVSIGFDDLTFAMILTIKDLPLVGVSVLFCEFSVAMRGAKRPGAVVFLS